MRRIALILTLTSVLFFGCERVFTTSPFAFLQRDPSTYTDEQARSYAENALASGNEAAMAEAFGLLADSTDPETQLIAVELALGAAGMETVLTGLVGSLAAEGSDPESVVTAALEEFTEEDIALLVSAGGLLDSAEEGTSPTAEQYAFVAIGLIAAAADEVGVDGLDPPPPGSDAEAYVDQATTFLSAAKALLEAEGGSSDILEGFTGLIPET